MHLLCVSSHALHIVGAVEFGISFLNQSCRSVFGNFKTSLSFRSDYGYLGISLSFLLDLVGFSLLHNFHSLGLSSYFGEMLLVFGFNDFDGLILHSKNFLPELSCLFYNLTIQKVDFRDINIMLKLKKLLHVIPLKLKNLLIFVIDDSDHFVLLLFDLLLEVDIVVGGSHQSDSQVTRDDHVHNVYLFDHNTVLSESYLKGGE